MFVSYTLRSMGVTERFMKIAFMPGWRVDLRHNMAPRICGNAISHLLQGSCNLFGTENLKIGLRVLDKSSRVTYLPERKEKEGRKEEDRKGLF